MRSIAASLFALALSAGVAAAETPQEQADKLFAEGRELLVSKNDAKAACEKFEAAIRLDSTAPGVMLNLGLCYEKLERYATSLYWFRKAQAAAAEAKADEFEQAAKDHTTVLVEKVAIGRIDTTGLPPDAEITIEGRRVAPAEFGRVELDHGANRVEARARGKQPYSGVHEVRARDAGVIQIELKGEIVYETVDAGAGRRKAAYAVGGGAIAFGVACVVANLKWRSDANEHRNDPTSTLTDEANEKMAKWGTALFGASVALGVTSVVLYVTAPGIERREVQQARLVPVVTPDGAGLAFGGRF